MTFSSAKGAQKFLVLSVDWEKDCSIWRYPSTETDYGGILRATGPVLSLLEEKGIKANWFVECHSDYPEHHTPGLFPEMIKDVAERSHEIGIHIHWAKRNGTRWIYPVRDEGWVSGLLTHARDSLSALGISPLSFRGGAFLTVPGLPRILKKTGIAFDSSVFRGLTYHWPITIRDRIRTKFTYFSEAPKPYYCSDVDSRLPGASDIIQFPVSFNIFGILRHKMLKRRFFDELRSRENRFCVVYFHINQFTLPESVPDEKAEPDIKAIDDLSSLLGLLRKSNQISFLTLSEAGMRFQEEQRCDAKRR